MAHGYWHWDWADCYRRLGSVTPIAGSKGTNAVNVSFKPGGSKGDIIYEVTESNARFYGVNLLTELDQPGEYFIDRAKLRLHFLPPNW